MSFVQQAFAERILFLYPTAPYSSSGSLSQFKTSSFVVSNQDSRSLSLIEVEVGVGDVMPISVAIVIAVVGVLVAVDGWRIDDRVESDSETEGRVLVTASGPALAVMARMEDRKMIWVVGMGRRIFVLVERTVDGWIVSLVDVVWCLNGIVWSIRSGSLRSWLLLRGCIWSIGSYLSRRRYKGVLRNTRGKGAVRFQRP